MKISLTTLCGVAAAIAVAISQVQGCPEALRLHLLIVSAVCVALLGYFAQDRHPRPPLPAALILAVVVGGLAMVCSGCRLGGFTMQVKSPTFGSVGVAFDSGSIGNRAVSHTNALHQLPPP
jgi:peptidoglycan/LPS O-acetylase OafA/YrhL